MRFSYRNPVEIVGSHNALSDSHNSLHCDRLGYPPILISANGGGTPADHFAKLRLREALAFSVFYEFHGVMIIPKMARSQYPQTGNCQKRPSRRCSAAGR